jgi:hypothetical protein
MQRVQPYNVQGKRFSEQDPQSAGEDSQQNCMLNFYCSKLCSSTLAPHCIRTSEAGLCVLQRTQPTPHALAKRRRCRFPVSHALLESPKRVPGGAGAQQRTTAARVRCRATDGRQIGFGSLTVCMTRATLPRQVLFHGSLVRAGASLAPPAKPRAEGRGPRSVNQPQTQCIGLVVAHEAARPACSGLHREPPDWGNITRAAKALRALIPELLCAPCAWACRQLGRRWRKGAARPQAWRAREPSGLCGRCSGLRISSCVAAAALAALPLQPLRL